MDMNKTLVRFLCLLLPVRRWRYICRLVLTEGGVNWGRMRRGVRLFYWRERNFGDSLNENLMQLLNCPYEGTPAYFADAVCIGSLLEEFLLRKQGRIRRPVHVFGTGFIREAEPGQTDQFHRPMIFHALRGRLSLERCCAMTGANPEEIVLGDPGLLLKRIFPQIAKEPRYDVGIILHMADTNFPVMEHIRLRKLTWKMLDITLPPEEFVRQLCECRFILSSAMHGLIAADAMGIPNRHILLGERVVGGSYKFRDYYSAYTHVPYEPIALEGRVLGDEDIVRLREEYAVSPEEVEAISERLMQAFSKLPGLCPG